MTDAETPAISPNNVRRVFPAIFHVTPITPNAALMRVCAGRCLMVSMYRPDQLKLVREITANPDTEKRADHGRFSTWIAAMKAGHEWSQSDVPGPVYYRWLEEKFGIWDANATAIMPDIPGAPSQLNDAELLDWPFPAAKGLPVYHMDGPIARLGRLLDKYPLVCVGWVGHPKREPVGCPAYWARIEEIEAELGSDIWRRVHMLRGVAVSRMRPFRRRRQQQPGTEWASLRSSRRLPFVRPAREVAWAKDLCRPSGGKR